MNPGDEKDFIRAALEDPRADLPPELVEDLSVEERSMYQRHRVLDTNLRAGLKDLTAPMEARAPSEEAFKARLLEGIKKQPEPAGWFWLRLRLKDAGEKLRELFWYEPGPVYRWTPALVILLILPIVPLMLNEQSKQETARADAPLAVAGKKDQGLDDSKSKIALGQPSEKKSAADRRAYKEGLKKSARAKPSVLGFKAYSRKDSPAKPSTKRGGEKPNSEITRSAAAGASPKPALEPTKAEAPRLKREERKQSITRLARRSRSVSSDLSPAAPRNAGKKAKSAKRDFAAKTAVKEKDKVQTREQVLLERLKQARTPEAKRKILKELEQLYVAQSAVRKLREIREKLKTFK